jgi:hypothetical protein
MAFLTPLYTLLPGGVAACWGQLDIVFCNSLYLRSEKKYFPQNGTHQERQRENGPMKPGNPPAFSGKGANSGEVCSQDEGNSIDAAIPDDSGIFSPLQKTERETPL